MELKNAVRKLAAVVARKQAIEEKIAVLRTAMGRVEEVEADLRHDLAAQLAMTAERRASVVTAETILTVQLQSGRQSVEILDAALIPEAYTQVKVEVKKTEVSKALKAGTVVPGARLITGEDTVALSISPRV